MVDRPVESYSAARETIPYHNLIPYGPRSRHQRRRGRKPLITRLRGLSERRKYLNFPKPGPGGVPAENVFCAYLREAIWNTFSVFLSDGGPPNVARPEKTFPSSSLSTGLGRETMVSRAV